MLTIRRITYSLLALVIALAGVSVLSPAMLGETAQAMELASVQAEIQHAAPTIQESDTMTETEEMEGEEDTSEADTEEMTDADTESEVLIQLRDSVVTREQFDEAFIRAMHIYAVQQQIPLHQRTYDFYVDLRSQYLEQFALEQVLLNRAEELDINVSPTDAEYQILDFRRSFDSPTAYQDALRAMGFRNEEAFIEYVQDATAINAVLTGMRTDIDITDEEVEQFYQDNLQLFGISPGVYLPLEQVAEQVRAALERQELQQQVMDLREEQAVELFMGNLTPIEELVLEELEPLDDAVEEAETPATLDQTVTLTDVIAITVGDQVVAQNTIVVDRVYSVGPGFVVIHANDDGAPGEVLGFEAIPDGETENHAVVLDDEVTEDILWAMLHEDTGEENVFEFPDGDPPVVLDGNVVMDVFSVLEPPAADAMDEEEAMDLPEDTPELDSESTVDVTEEIGTIELQVMESDEYGPYLATASGAAVYVFSGDEEGNEAVCDEFCLEAWPPVLTEDTPMAMTDDIDADLLGTVETVAGMQATINDHPLYFNALDQEEEGIVGQGDESFGGEWYLVSPDGTPNLIMP